MAWTQRLPRRSAVSSFPPGYTRSSAAGGRRPDPVPERPGYDL
jgi:hypothetical protein